MKFKHTILTGTAIVVLLFITMLFAGCFTTGGSTNSGSSSESTQAAAPAKPAFIQDGTYTFYPRLRAIKGGLDTNIYLDRVVAKGGMVSFYLVDRPLAKGGTSGISSWRGTYSVLQDLDQPARTWNPVNETYNDEVTGGVSYTFQGITGTRFSFTNVDSKPSLEFEEIILTAPDVPLNLPPLKNGTYTFYPRLRASQGGVDKNVYLDRIVVRSGYFTIFLVDTPTGKGGTSGVNTWRGTYSILQDLDRPARAWNPVNETYNDEVTGGVSYSFQGITGTRFSFTNVDSRPPLVFEEIILGEPDA